MDDTSHPVARAMRRVARGCAFVSGLGLLLMMTAGAIDVVGANLDWVGLRAAPLPAAFEFMATMMVVTVFLATPLAQARRSHIQVEVLTALLPPGMQKALEAVQHLLSVAVWALIAWFGWRGGIHSVSVGEYAPGLINFPIWPARLILGFGASLMALQCLVDLFGVFAPSLRSREAHQAPPPPIS